MPLNIEINKSVIYPSTEILNDNVPFLITDGMHVILAYQFIKSYGDIYFSGVVLLGSSKMSTKQPVYFKYTGNFEPYIGELTISNK